MRLTKLEPRWVDENVFVFLCPHCRASTPGKEIWISCKSVSMAIQKQFELFISAGIEKDRPRYGIVPMNEEHAWTFSGHDFNTLTVTPSIDASASGHWHGFITNGEVT